MKSAAISPSEHETRRHPELQRTYGRSLVAWTSSGGRAALSRLEQEGAAKIRLPAPEPGDPPLAVVINTAGGLTGGDRIETAVAVGAGCRARATTQACERIYRSLGPDAVIDTRLKVGAGARLDWLPQECILFDGGRVTRRLDADVAAGGSLLAVEAAIFGRTAMGERIGHGLLHDRWRIVRDSRLVHADDLHMDWAIAGLLDNPATLAGAGAIATIVLVDEAASRLLHPVRAAISGAGGASAWNGKLVARIAAADGQSLRRALVPALTALLGGALPKPWQL